MKELEVFNLYDNADEKVVNTFNDKLESQMRVKTDYYKDENDISWLNVFEKILPYLEKIFRNPKRFIITEEEILKIESTKRVGVDTVKHLSKHTNLIQDIDKDTGDVLPSKLLNVNKEETFNTYENRFVYTLVFRMEEFIRIKLDNLVKDPKLKDNKNIEYRSTTLVGEEQVNVNINLNTHLDTKLELDKDFYTRLQNIQNLIKDLKFTELFRALEKEDVAFVTSPIKKTNVILKNVNFQYAMELWNYINLHINDKDESKKKNKNYLDKGDLKKFIDESFFLDYLTISTLNNEGKDLKLSTEKTISRILDKIIDLNPELTKKELQDKLGAEFDKAHQRRNIVKNDIEKIFKRYIDKFFEKEITYK